MFEDELKQTVAHECDNQFGQARTATQVGNIKGNAGARITQRTMKQNLQDQQQYLIRELTCLQKKIDFLDQHPVVEKWFELES